MDQAKQQPLNALREQLDYIAGCDPAHLAERKELGEINFLKGKELFQQVVDLGKEVKPLPLELLPVATLNQLQKPAKELAEILKRIASFKLVGSSNPEQARNSLLESLQTQYDSTFTAMTPHVPYLSLKSAQVQETVRRSAELLDETQRQVAEGLQAMQKKMAEMDSIVKAAQDAAVKVGVAHFATKFEEIAQEHDEEANRWLKVTAGLGAATAGVAVAFLWLLPPLSDIKDAATIQRIITKLVVISIFYFAALWSSRNYRAHRHLSVVNKHRQNALATFQTFVKAAGEDQPTKNAVLMETTRCIFAPATTGYLSGDEEMNPSNRMVEILNTVSGAAGQK